jgi:hypothetical protein
MAKAEDLPTNSGYPYLAESNCSKSVKLPKNSGGILFNKDCTVGFVYPERVGTAKLVPRASSALTLCPQLSKMKKEIQEYIEIRQVWRKRLLTASAAETDKIFAVIEQINKLEADSRSQLDRIEAMRVNVTFENRVEKTVNEAQRINQEVFGDSVRFQAAPISAGRLQYLVESPGDLTRDFKAVLSTAIPGNEKSVNADQGEVDFNGALQGEMALTLNGACPFIDTVVNPKDNKKYLTINDQKLNHTITANYTYAVPVQSSAVYTASLNGVAALSSLQRRAGVTEKFFKSDVTDAFLNSTAENILSIQIDNLETPETDDLDRFRSFLTADIADRLTQRFMAVLEQNKLVIAGPAAFIQPEVKDATMTGVRRECRSSSSFFGFQSSSRCYDVPYTYQVPAANVAEMISKIQQGWNVVIEEHSVLNQIIYRRGTSAFALKPTQQVLMEAE